MRLLIGVCADVDQHFIPVKHETWKRKMCLQDARKHTILCFWGLFFSEDVAADIWAAPNMTQQKCWLRKVRLHLFFVCTLCSIVHLCFQPMFLFADTTVLPVLRLASVLHLTKASSNLHTFTSVSYIIFTFRAFSMMFIMLFAECFKGRFLSLIPKFWCCGRAANAIYIPRAPVFWESGLKDTAFLHV